MSSILSSIILNPRRTILDGNLTWKVIALSSFMIISKLHQTLGLEGKSYYLEEYQMLIDYNMPIVSSLGHIISGFLVGFGTRVSVGFLKYSNQRHHQLSLLF